MKDGDVFISSQQRRKVVDKLRAKGLMVPHTVELDVIASYVATHKGIPIPEGKVAQGMLIIRFLSGDVVTGGLPPFKPLRQTLAEKIAQAKARELFAVKGFTDKLKVSA